MSFAVTTHSYDNARTASNTRETLLTPEQVKRRGIRHLFSLKLPPDARGCDAQPLVVPGVKMKDGSVHDTVYVATLNNQVLAFDANTGAELWRVHLGMSVCDEPADGGHGSHRGILSTPVVDMRTPVLYVCAWSSVDGSRHDARHSLHALRLQDGVDAHPPIQFDGVKHDPGHGRQIRHFVSATLEQRAALLLTDDALFLAFGRIDVDASGHGWLIAVDLATFCISAAWASTAQGNGGDILQSGSGPAADAQGYVYVQTGHGDFDAVTDFGESIVKLKYTPPRLGVSGRLAVVDWWTPWTDAARGGRELGWSGPVIAADAGSLLASMSDGILYTADASALGMTRPDDLSAERSAANYAKLKVSPIFYTYFPGPHPSPAPDDAGKLVFTYGDRTFHLHGGPCLWHSAAHGPMHFCWGENGNLRSWSLSPAGKSVYLGCSAEWASENATAPPGGIPGGSITVSANGKTDGIVWGSIPYGDCRRQPSPGRFLAYDAQVFGEYANGYGSMPALWDSQDWSWQFNHNPYSRPVICNGHVYLPTQGGDVWVLGLA